MKLEEGKYYYNYIGWKVGPMETSEYSDRYWSPDGTTYLSNGRGRSAFISLLCEAHPDSVLKRVCQALARLV